MEPKFLRVEEVAQELSVSKPYAHLFPSKQSEMAKKLDFERSEL